MDFYKIVLSFTIYSFLGWVVETIYCSIIEKKFIYRGFLTGPFCTIYGFGALLVLFLLRDLQNNILLLFLVSMVVTSTLEYVTSYVLEKIFHMKWWDYSKRFANLNGRICLWNSLLFGLLSLVLVKVINPEVSKLINSLPSMFIQISAITLIIYFAADTIWTSKNLLSLRVDLKEIEKTLEIEFKKLHEQIHLGFTIRRMLNSYPRARSNRYEKALESLRDRLPNRNR